MCRGRHKHDLRHTCLTLLLDERTPPHVVQQIAGHAALYATMTIYAHASTDQRRTALDRLGDQLSAPDDVPGEARTDRPG